VFSCPLGDLPRRYCNLNAVLECGLDGLLNPRRTQGIRSPPPLFAIPARPQAGARPDRAPVRTRTAQETAAALALNLRSKARVGMSSSRCSLNAPTFAAGSPIGAATLLRLDVDYVSPADPAEPYRRPAPSS
jgi:hypothetical protein